jgi:hypothetical protein
MKIFGIIVVILIGLFVAMLLLGNNSGYPEVGDAVILPRENTPGCPSKSVAALFISLINQGDGTAAAKLGYRQKCTFSKSGEQFTLQIKEPLEDYWCVRRAGEPDCVWVAKTNVEKSK